MSILFVASIRPYSTLDKTLAWIVSLLHILYGALGAGFSESRLFWLIGDYRGTMCLWDSLYF